MMSETPPTSPIALAESILQLVTSVFSAPAPSPNVQKKTTLDPLAFYNTKIRIQDLCDKLIQSVLGRLEYTILLAGKSHFLTPTLPHF